MTSREVSERLKVANTQSEPKKKTTRSKAGRAPTLNDVAKLAGVSRWVVGSVLNGGSGNSRCSKDTEDKVREAARILSYHPNHAARLLRGKRSHTFGMLVAAAGDPLRSFLVQFLDAESVKIGCNTIIGNTVVGPDRFEACIDDFVRRGVDGVLYAVHHWFDVDRESLVKRIPNVVFYEDPGIENAAYVAVDRSESVRLAVRHLIERGSRRIGLAVMSLSRPTHLDRQSGFQAELASHGREFESDLVFNGEPFGLAYARYDRSTNRWNFPTEMMDLVIDKLVVDQKADAIVAHDDFWAAALIRRLRARGIDVPNQVAVVGYLNHYLADWTEPPLTTIDLQHETAAHQMVGLLERMVNEESLGAEDRVVKVQPKLIVRESA